MSQQAAETFMLEDGGPRHVRASWGRGVWFAVCGKRGRPVFAGTMPLGTYLRHDRAMRELCADCRARLML